MALSFPLSVSEFWGDLKIESMRLWSNEPQSQTRLGDGSILRSSLGAELWQGQVNLVTAYHQDQAAIDAVISVAARAGSSFFAYDTRFNGPKEDPNGTALGASTVTIDALGVNNRAMTLTGLPVGYRLRPGDRIGWQYGSPARYAMHAVVRGGIADGNGDLLIEVTPFIRAGVTVGTEVTLIQPVIKAVLTEPQYGAAGPVFTGGAQFSFIQTLST